jgi:hypothetical protein
MATGDNSRFDSWKEIAAYLGRDVRTVMRWEKECGLEVHRVPGRRRGAIYAYQREIDVWLAQAHQRLAGTGTWLSASSAPGNEWSPRKGVVRNTPTLESSATPQRENSGSPGRGNVAADQPRFATFAGAILIVGVVLSLFVASTQTKGQPSSMPPSVEPPRISSISPILPEANQSIVIEGSGFGLFVPYQNSDTPFIAIRDKSAGWAAGRLIAQNWDEITLNVKSWHDKQIVVSGFSGAYGSGAWKLSPGDQIEVAIWNPESASGPAIYHLVVSARRKD